MKKKTVYWASILLLFIFLIFMRYAWGNSSIITLTITKHNGTQVWTEHAQVNSANYVNNVLVLDVITDRIFKNGFN